jgi:hypothetical protein
MSIYLTLSGLDRVRKTNYFTHEELAIINGALNLASFVLKTKNSDILYNDSVMRLPKFETKVRGKYGNYVKNSRVNFGPNAMKKFSEVFDNALQKICEMDDLVTFLTPLYTGMRFDDGEGLDPIRLKAAAECLSRGVHFTANLAGIKDIFKEKESFIAEFNTDFSKQYNDADWERYMKGVTEDAYKFLKKEVFVNSVVSDKDIYHFDLGLEIVPTFDMGESFLVNMKYAEKQLKKIFSKKRSHDAYVDILEFTNDDTVNSDVDECIGNNPPPGRETVETPMLNPADQLLFDVGELFSVQDINDPPADDTGSEKGSESAGNVVNHVEDEDENEISARDLFYEQKRLGVNTYEKFLTNGNIGGVHSGPALIRFKETQSDNMAFIDRDRVQTTREVMSS